MRRLRYSWNKKVVYQPYISATKDIRVIAIFMISVEACSAFSEVLRIILSALDALIKFGVTCVSSKSKLSGYRHPTRYSLRSLSIRLDCHSLIKLRVSGQLS